MKLIKSMLILPIFFALLSTNVAANEKENMLQKIQDYCAAKFPDVNDAQDQALMDKCIESKSAALNRDTGSEISNCAADDAECYQGFYQNDNPIIYQNDNPIIYQNDNSGDNSGDNYDQNNFNSDENQNND